MLLVTGFEPYGGQRINPSQLILGRLAIHPLFRRLRLVLLKCDSAETPSYVVTLAQQSDVSAVLLLGEDKRYAVPTIEKKCYNLLDYDVPDNFGRQPRASAIYVDGPDELTTSIDLAAVHRVLSTQGVIVEDSSDPGRHLCNHVYFSVCYLVPDKPSLLLHLPRIPEQTWSPGAPLESSYQAVGAIIVAISGEPE